MASIIVFQNKIKFLLEINQKIFNNFIVLLSKMGEKVWNIWFKKLTSSSFITSTEGEVAFWVSQK